jgi:hypothetical protein
MLFAHSHFEEIKSMTDSQPANGKEQFGNVLERYKTGGDYYITKPFTRNHVVNSINSILS